MTVDILRLSTDLQCRLLYKLTAAAPPGIDAMLEDIVAYAADILSASACSIFIKEPEGNRARQRAGSGHQKTGVGAYCPIVTREEAERPPADGRPKLGLTGWILSTGRSFLAQSPEELEAHPHRTGEHDRDQLPDTPLRLQTFLGVPLRGLFGEVIGLLKAERRQDEGSPIPVTPFSITDQIVLETMARVASKCHVYLSMAQDHRLEEAITAWARDVVAEAVATEGDLDNFLNIVVNVSAAAMHADSSGIYLADTLKKTLTQRAGIRSQAPRHVIRSYPLWPADQLEAKRPVGLTAWIAITGTPFWANNKAQLSQHPHHRGEFDQWNFPSAEGTICGAFVGVPLRVGGTVIGVLKVENISRVGEVDERVFSADARGRFDVLAQDIALDIERLKEQGGARYRVILDAQKPISEILRGNLEIPELVKKVVTSVAELLNARACALFLVEGDRLVQPTWAAMGYSTRGPLRQYQLVDPDQLEARRPVGLTVWIAVTRQPFTARSFLELSSHPHHRGTYDRHNFEAEQRCESFMGTALTSGDDLVGVLKVETKMRVSGTEEEYTYFSDQDELVFKLIANSAASAIENARLVEAERMAEKISSQRSDVLIELHRAAADSWNAASSLHRAADLLKGEMPQLSQIVDHFASLMENEPVETHLNALSHLLEQQGESAYKGAAASAALYRICLRALAARTFDDLHALCKDNPLYESGFDRHLFLSGPAGLLRQLFNDMAATMMDRLGFKEQPQLLADLAKARAAAGDLAQPERNLVLRLIESWDVTVQTETHFLKVEPNPYLTGRPVDPRQNTPFFGRQDVFDWLEENLEGAHQSNVVTLYGERRMGKTSILLQLESGPLGGRLRSRIHRPVKPVFVDLQSLDAEHCTGADLLTKIASEVDKKVGPFTDALSGAQIDAPRFDCGAGSTYDAVRTYLECVDVALGNTLLVLMLDEFELLDKVVKASGDATIYDQLRHHMQHRRNIAFILAGMHQLTRLSPQYSSLIYANALHCRVGFMDAASARRLVCDQVAGKVVFRDEAVDELLALTCGHPHLLQTLCHGVIEEMNAAAKSNVATVDLVQKVANSRAAEPLFFLFLTEFLSDDEFTVLRTLGAAASGGGLATVAEIAARLPALEVEKVRDVLYQMEQRQIVEELTRAGAPAQYRVIIPLLQRWLEKTGLSSRPSGILSSGSLDATRLIVPVDTGGLP